MKQIILNWLLIFIGPPVLGFAVRLFCRRWKRAYFITVCPLLLTAAAWIAVWTVPIRGSELYGLTAWQASLAAAGSLAAEGGLWLAGKVTVYRGAMTLHGTSWPKTALYRYSKGESVDVIIK